MPVHSILHQTTNELINKMLSALFGYSFGPYVFRPHDARSCRVAKALYDSCHSNETMTPKRRLKQGRRQPDRYFRRSLAPDVSDSQ